MMACKINPPITKPTHTWIAWQITWISVWRATLRFSTIGENEAFCTSEPSPCALTAPYFSLFAQRKVSKRKRTPTSGFGGCAAKLPSFRCRSGGRLTRAIHGPLSLSPHPCGSSPCATPPLGLLTGTRAPRCLVVFLGAARIDRSHALRGNAAFGSLRPLLVLCCWRLCDAERHGMGSHTERGDHRLRKTFRQRQTPLQEGERNRRGRG